MLGDIFDLWISDHQYFANKFAPIISELKALQKRGVGIHYFEGNHDLYLQAFWQERLGFMVHENGGIFQVGAYRVWVEHGDLIDQEDHGYLFLRWILRTPPLKFLAHNLPDQAVAWIGERASNASRTYTSTTKTMPKTRAIEKIREHALHLSQQDASLDFVISGHLHARDDHAFQRGNKTVRSVNLGTWLEKPVTYVIDADGGRWSEITSAK